MPGNRLESLRVKQSGAFDLIYDTNFMEKSSIRSSIRSAGWSGGGGGSGSKVVEGGGEGGRGEGRKICSNVAGVIEIGATGNYRFLPAANETANDEQTSFRKYLSRRSINGNAVSVKELNAPSFTSGFVAVDETVCSSKGGIISFAVYNPTRYRGLIRLALSRTPMAYDR